MRLLKQFEPGLLWPFYLGHLIQAFFILTAAYWVIYFLSLGHSLATISLLPITMLLTSLALEVPTGFLADLTGRKSVVILAIFIEAGAICLIPLLAAHFGLLLVLYGLMGIGAALASGASEAWVVDLLHWHAKPQAVSSYYAALHALINIGFIASPLLASLIFFLTDSMHVLWWIQGGMLFLVGCILIIFGKEKRQKQDGQQTAKAIWKTTLIQLRTNPKLLLMLAVMLLLSLFFGLTTLAWQPFLLEAGVSLAWFGVLFAFTGMLAITYPLFQSRLARIRNRLLLQFISFVQMLALVLLAFMPFVGVIVIFFLVQNLDSLKLPIFQPWFQKHIPSTARSTLGSVMAIVGALGEGFGYLIAGQLSDVIGIGAVWWLAAGISATLVCLFYFSNRSIDITLSNGT